MRDEKPTSVKFMGGDDHGLTAEVYRCQVPLEELEGTERDDVKFCGHCAKSVYRVQNISGFFDMVAAGQCVWVEPQDYLSSGCAPLLGSPAPPFDPVLLSPVNEMDIRPSIVYRLEGAGVNFLGVLVQLTEEILLKKVHLAPEEIKEVESMLAAHGLILNMRVAAWPVDGFDG